MNMLSTISAAGAAAAGGRSQGGSFGMDVNGDGAMVVVTGASTANAIPLDQAVHSGDPALRDIRLAYEVQAEAAGLDPAAIEPGSPEDRQVVADLAATLDAVGRLPRGRGTVASAMEGLRSQAEATVAQRTAASEAGMSVTALAGAAHAPGAALAADLLPVTRTLSQASAELRRAPAAAVAGTIGAAAGTAIAVGAGRLNDAGAPVAEKPVADERAEVKAALDTNRDDVLQCDEIGQWVPDVGYGARSTNAQAYQTHVTGRAGMDFEVRPPVGRMIRFDGCVDQPDGAKLLEAKADHGGLLIADLPDWFRGGGAVLKQGQDQEAAANAIGVVAEWHVQTLKDTVALTAIFEHNEVFLPVLHDAMPLVK